VEDEQAGVLGPVAARTVLGQRHQHLDAVIAQPAEVLRLGRAGQGRQQRLVDPAESGRRRHEQLLRGDLSPQPPPLRGEGDPNLVLPPPSQGRGLGVRFPPQRSGGWPKRCRSWLACSHTLSSPRRKSVRLAVLTPSAAAASLTRPVVASSTSSTTPTAGQ